MASFASAAPAPGITMLLLVSILLAAGVLLASQRYGSRQIVPATGLVCLLSTLLFDASIGVAPLMGLIAGVQIERRATYGQVVALAVLPAAVLSGWMLITQDNQRRSQVGESLTAQLEIMGMQTEAANHGLHEMVALIVRVQPALQFVTLLFTAVLAYRTASWAAPWFNLSLPVERPFRLWRPWDELIWAVIGGLGMWLASSGIPRDLGLNIVLVMVVLYAVHGTAVLRYFLQRLGITRLLELTVYASLFFTAGVSLILLAGLGLMDTWFDWRRLRPAASEEGTG